MKDVTMVDIVVEVVEVMTGTEGNHRLTKGAMTTEDDQDLGLIHHVDTTIK